MKYWVLLLMFVVVAGCSSEQPEGKIDDKKGTQKELLVFCGITMIQPVQKLMTQFEREHQVKMVMSYGGSADLMQSIRVNKKGDIYFPGVESFIKEADQEGLLKERKQVGINQAAFFVKKGNPKHFHGDLNELLRSGVQVGIGHPDLGSIGKETKRLLQAKGIYDKVVSAAAIMQPDSKALSADLREGKVDIVINWKAVLHTQDNADYMDMIPIKGDWAVPHNLVMAVTSMSTEPELARSFLELCASSQGNAVFKRYGY